MELQFQTSITITRMWRDASSLSVLFPSLLLTLTNFLHYIFSVNEVVAWKSLSQIVKQL